jgi:uncharacterized membrane protein (DUF4010 family)
MFSLSNYEPWWRFGFSLVIGALIGLEREFYQQKEGTPDFAGIRTFSLIALLGSVSSFLANDYGIILAALSLGGLILMTIVSYYGELVRRETEVGITTEVAAILTFLFGVLVMSEHAVVAIALAVITSLIITFKGELHGFIKNMSPEDIHVTLEFALIAAVIYPLLPNRTIDPLELLNPSQIWLMVILVSGIGFSGYFLMKILGPSQGINVMGILGGLASSTATTISFSSASKEHPDMTYHYARAIIIASTVMFPRVLFLILVIYPPLVLKVIIPFALMVSTGLIFNLLTQKKEQNTSDTVHPDYKITNPLKISTAIKFGLIYAFVVVGMEYAQKFFGTSGVYLTSFLTGLTGIQAITLNITHLAENAQVSSDVAGIALIIAVLMNTVSKGAISYYSGSPELRKQVIKAFLLMILVGVISSAIVFYLF